MNDDRKIIDTHEPQDAEYYANGLYYKIGIHGFVYKWMGLEWTKSSLQPEHIKNHKRVYPHAK